jgi:KDO2-lipid IV(A) lauroyltransferase
MMAKFVFYFLAIPISYLPLRILYLLSDLFYLLLISIIPYRKEVIEQNLKHSFPHKSNKELHIIKRKFYRHFSDLLAEGIKNLSISKKELTKRFTIKNPELMDKLYNQKKSVVFVSGHYNNWEWLITSQNFLFPHQALGIGMPMTSKFWDKKINERRQRFGMKVINSKNFKDEINKYSQHPIALLTLSDQSPGDARKSYWMEFLNQQTAVLFGPEQIAHEYNFAVVFFVIHKIKRGYYEMGLKLLSDDTSTCNWGEITENHTRLLEKEIIENPQFWIWSHKRWKRTIPNDLEQLKMEQHAKFDKRFKNN